MYESFWLMRTLVHLACMMIIHLSLDGTAFDAKRTKIVTLFGDVSCCALEDLISMICHGHVGM